MRLQIILGTLLLSGSLTQAESQPPTQLAAAGITAPPSSQVAASARATPRTVWYNDPIVFGLAVFALFAAIDIAILIAKNSQHPSDRHAMN